MTVPKGQVVGARKCPGCGTQQPLKGTKGGTVCLVCGVCNTRLFFGAEPTARLVKEHGGGSAPDTSTAQDARDQGERHWFYG
jgi:uncharacterized Zn finger protein (UPF0148 family)